MKARACSGCSTPLLSQADMQGTFGPGTILLGKYRVESMLGRGGMGVVLRVTHLHLGEDLALKILSPEAAATPDVNARFLREAQSVGRLRGEHVARVSDVGLLPEGVPYMVMEYLHGVDLADELNRRTMLIPGEATDYVLQACEALAEAHAHGIVHRDIKPANLFLTTRPDGTPLVKVLDFGISKSPVNASALLTRTETVMGTPGYMSPEQMKATRDVDARTDIWSLGIVLYECLCGRRPFEAESFSAVVLLTGTEPPPPMDLRIPRGLQATVLRCLEKDRAARFSSIAELAAALAPFARDQRSAAVIVDRTNLMLRGAYNGRALADRSAHSPTATTLSGRAGRSRRRPYVIAGVMSLLGAIAILTAGTVGDAGHARNAAPTMADRADADEGTRKIARCIELAARREWTELNNCASELDALGIKEKAGEFHTKAKQESENEIQAGKFRDAIRDHNLKKAEALLSAIGEASVYYALLRDTFTKTETPVIEEAKRKTESFAAAHDCKGLDSYVAQLADTSTSRVIAVVQTVKCVDNAPSVDATVATTPVGGQRRSQPPPVPSPPKDPCETMQVDDLVSGAATQYSAGYAKPALSLMSKALTCKQDVRMYRLAATYACAAHDFKAAQLYLAKVPAQFQPAISQRCEQEGFKPKGPCDTTNIDDLVSRAATQYSAGYAKPALSLMSKALACKQDVRMYRLAATYACAAQDLASAKVYFAKVPAQFQAAISAKCQQEGLDVRWP